MDLNSVLDNARKKFNGKCVICRECNGVWCRGMVPGMGGAGDGSTMQRNYQKLKELRVVMKTIHGVKDPQLKTKFFGEEIDLPVIIAPVTGMNYNVGGGITEKEYIEDIIMGSIESKTLAMIGDGGDPELYNLGIEGLKKVGGRGIAIIKPRANEEIIKRIKKAEEVGALAVGIDIDGAGLVTMGMMGQPVGPKSKEELRELVESTNLPFILKGIVTPEEAKIALEVGVAGIVVSNHGGRVLNSSISAIEVVEEIKKAVGDKLLVIADGGVREGVDVLKFLAMGADLVLVGRPIIWGSLGGRKEGVKLILKKLKDQLHQSMILTGVEKVEKVDGKIIYKK